MGQPPQSAVALGFALAMSSTALVLPIAGTTSPVGKAALAMLLFEDLGAGPAAVPARHARRAARDGPCLDVVWKGAR